MDQNIFDLDAFRAAPLERAPYEHLVLRKFIKPEALRRINSDYPTIAQSGSFPLDSVKFGLGFQAMVDALESEEFRKAFEEKFGLDLTSRPTTITVRGRCGAHDGKIHNDSTSKIITVLLYLNPTWDDSGGRLRILRSPDDINDVASEVPLPTALSSPSCVPTVPGTDICRSKASAASFSSIGSTVAATSASPFSAIVFPLP